jgi:two-component system NarL family sensor kinase
MDTIESSLFVTIAITSIVIGVIILYFSVTMIRSHKRHFIKLRSYYIQEVELIEKERMRIARDLHDELGPLLTITKILVGVSKGRTDKDKEQLQKANENLDNLHARFGDIARNLTPAMLVNNGLRKTLMNFSGLIEDACGAKICTYYQLNEEPSTRFSLQIYRIVQELFHNGAKHASASKIYLYISEHKRNLIISYEDNGKGFTLNTEIENGLGLSSIRNRVTILGGTINIASSPGKGVSIFILTPMEANEGRNK